MDHGKRPREVVGVANTIQEDELVRHAIFSQQFIQINGLFLGNGFVGRSMEQQNGWRIRRNVGHRRK